MNKRFIVDIALSAAIAFGFLCDIGMRAAWTAAAPPTEACTRAMNNATVDDAFKVGAQAPAGRAQKSTTVSLGDTIAVRISSLAELQSACTAMPIVLYLNNYPIKSLTPFPPTPPPTPAAGGSPPNSGVLNFVLNVTDDSRASWTPILGSPSFSERDLKVSVGIEDQYPLRPAAGKALPEFKLDIIGNIWFAIWVVIFAVLFGGFLWCARNTDIILDGNPTTAANHPPGAHPPPGEVGIRGTYSLSKFQGAWWLFVILAAYLFIGIVTGDFRNSINSTALILLGIGAGTIIGSATIDALKETQDAPKINAAITATRDNLTQIEEKLKPEQLANDEGLKQRLNSEKDQTLSNYRKLTGQNEQFLTDILSDANGVSFHRFQLLAWTLVLGLVFITSVYESLAMPEFNTTLMGLLGLSAGTYLGLKIPEATTPKT